MASANIRGCSAQDRVWTLKDMKNMQEEFAKDAFEFLLQNAHIWIEYPKNFMTSYRKLGKSYVFPASAGKAIITIAYLLRLEYRKQFKKNVELMRDPNMYEYILKNYEIFKDELYFYNFLAWVAFAFDLTMNCYKEGYNYIKRGECCLANYPDLEYFHSSGGFLSLIECSVHMAVLYDYMEPVFSEELPRDDVIVRFIKCVENIERQNRYNNKWLIVEPEMRYIKQIKENLSAKCSVVSSLDPQRVTSGYKVILKKPQTKLPKKASSGSKVQVYDSTNLDYDKNEETFIDVTSRISKGNISEECSNDRDILGKTESTDYSNPIFIIHKRFLDKRKESNKDSKNKRGLKICCPSEKSGRLAMNLNQILEENIESGHFSKIGDSIYSNCPPGHRIADLDAQFIVLDTSSEEEDCGKPEPFEILEALLSRYEDCVSTKSNSQKIRSQPKEADEILFEPSSSKSIELESVEITAAIATVQTCEQVKCTESASKKSAENLFSEKKNIVLSKSTDAKSKERLTAISAEQKMSASSKITETESKQSGTEMHSEQKFVIPTEITGERPKIRKNTSKGSPGKVLPTENRSRDLEDSDKNNKSRKVNSPKKSPRKEKKNQKMIDYTKDAINTGKLK